MKQIFHSRSAKDSSVYSLTWQRLKGMKTDCFIRPQPVIQPNNQLWSKQANAEGSHGPAKPHEPHKGPAMKDDPRIPISCKLKMKTKM